MDMHSTSEAAVESQLVLFPLYCSFARACLHVFEFAALRFVVILAHVLVESCNTYIVQVVLDVLHGLVYSCPLTGNVPSHFWHMAASNRHASVALDEPSRPVG